MSLSPVNDEPKITRTAHAMLVPWGMKLTLYCRYFFAEAGY